MRLAGPPILPGAQRPMGVAGPMLEAGAQRVMRLAGPALRHGAQRTVRVAGLCRVCGVWQQVHACTMQKQQVPEVKRSF